MLNRRNQKGRSMDRVVVHIRGGMRRCKRKGKIMRDRDAVVCYAMPCADVHVVSSGFRGRGAR